MPRPTFLLEIWNQAYSFVELFCGEAWVSKVMRAGGHCTASLDIRLGEACPGKQNAYDLLSDPGFAFLWLGVGGMALMTTVFQVSPPKDIIHLGLHSILFYMVVQLPETESNRG